MCGCVDPCDFWSVGGESFGFWYKMCDFWYKVWDFDVWGFILGLIQCLD